MTGAGGKRIFETAAAAKKFSMRTMVVAVVAASSEIGTFKTYVDIKKILGDSLAGYVLQGMLRTTFMIELVKAPKIETTKFEVRWAERLSTADPRYTSYDSCLEIFERLITDLAIALEEEPNRELLRGFQGKHLLPYEVPLDYRERRIASAIHLADNVIWMWDDLPKRVVKLRTFLKTKTSNPYAAFFNIAYAKIKVKTYLTDRVLTGEHKTNREKRWETHPGSVHFAERRSCLEIENLLVDQLCRFDGFPADLLLSLEEAGLITPPTALFHCPITLDPLLFAEFEKEVRGPEHGRASFQVGHLNPLKALNDDPRSGHTAQNISWVSSDGNRIQGSLPLDETRALIRRIYDNYERSGLL